MKKTAISLLLVLCIMVFAVSAISVEADAATTYTSGDWTYSVDSGVATITKYSGNEATVTIPKMMDGLYLVNAIGEKAFQGNSTMTSVSFPDTLTVIGTRAFSGCVALKSVTLPAKLATLGERSFENCFNLTKITVKSTALNNIGNAYGVNGQPFYQAGIGTDGISVVFSSGVTRIPNDMFYARAGDAYAPNITSVTIADSVTSIGNYAFYGCVYLKSVDFGNGVQTIGEYAFKNCSALKSIALPTDSLLKINRYAFSNCTKLANVSLPGTLTDIGDYAFESCVSFTSITLPVNIANLGQRAFQNCTNVSAITVNSAAMNNISNNYGTNGSPFYGVGSATDGITVKFGSKCTKIPARLFNASANPAYAANIVSVTIPSSVTYIGDSAFRSNATLKTVSMGDGVTYIDPYAFASCTGLTTVSYSSKLTNIKDHAFLDCTSLKSGTLPASLTTIGEYAFENCNALTSVTLPKGLSSLGQRAFQNCQKITKITVKSSELHDIGNYYGTNGQPFYCAGIDSTGITVVFENGVTRIAGNLFGAHSGEGYAPKIKKVTVADTVTEVGQNAFLNCTDMTYIRFFGDAPAIADNAFSAVSTIAYYPLNKDWTSEDRVDYGGDLTWKGFYTAQITTQPKTTYTKSGSTAKVSVKAVGDDAEYQWYVRNAGSSSYSKSSITSATYSTKMSSSTKDRRVYCVVTDKYGNSVKSNVVYLRMAATVTTQPKSVVVAKGETAKVSFKAAGDGLTYTWYYKDAGSDSFKKTTAFTGNSYSIEMTAARHGRQVYCKVTDKYGKTVTTNTVTLSMEATITTQPKTSYTKSGDTAKATVKATGDGLKYQWYVRNAGASSYTESSITSATYSVKMTNSVKNRRVYCVVTDKYGNSVKSSVVYLRMTATITTQPKTVVVAKGDMAKVTLKAAGDDLTYTWYYKDAGSDSFKKTTAFTGNSYSVQMSDARHGRKVYCKITDKYGNTVKTNTVSLCMEATVISQPKSVTVSKGETAKVSFKAKGSSLKYEWYYKDNGATSFKKTTAFTGNSYSIEMTAARNGRQVYCKITDQFGNTAKTKTVTLKMD